MFGRNQDSDETERRTGRRSILKASAVGLATVATSGTAVTAARNRSNEASDVHAATGNVNSPVSERQRRTVRERAVADYERNTGDTVDAVPAARPEAGGEGPDSSEEGTVVAYAYGVDADGVGRSYVGLASESETARAQATEGRTGPRAEDLIHDRFENRVGDISRRLEASDADVTTQSVGGTVNDVENMEQVYNTQIEYANDPYGVVSSTYYWLQDTAGNEEGSLHGLHSPTTIEPGYRAFGSSWKNEKAWNKHRWDETQMAWHDVGDGFWKPAGPSDGGSVSTSYSISATLGWSPGITFGVNWSYSEPAMERTDQSSQYNGYCQWKWDVQDKCDGSVRKSTLAMQPTSTCDMEDHDPSMGDKDISKAEVRGRFTEDCDGWHEQWTSTTFYKDT
ncbi:hypothetical protein [Halorussus aquaticus]|uniref:Uncharacterized protein n=1 Tax=Halorussus aquaticus TaxID=2953748 RepID=A0ABD5Q5D8_9EURY|nr:hypothetical protein [Halorussus aquaticus]